MLRLPKCDDSEVEGVDLVPKQHEKTPPYKNIVNTVFVPEYFEFSVITRTHHPYLGIAGTEYKTAIVFTTDDEMRFGVFEQETVVIPLPAETKVTNATLSEGLDAPPDESGETKEIYGLWLYFEIIDQEGMDYSCPVLLQQYMEYTYPMQSTRIH